MFRSDRRLFAASAIVVLAMAAVAIAALGRLPAGTQLPTHWNAAGEADGFADAGTALFLPVFLAIGLSAILAVVPRIEPLQDRLSGSRPLFATAWLGLLAIMALIELFVAAPAFGWTLPAATPLVAVGALFVLLGNALPKSRPGFFVGIRTPWTIVDADTWIATHRLGGKLMIAGGLVVIAAALLPLGEDLRSAAVIAAVAVIVLVPIGYSWWHWRRGTAG